MPAVYQLAREHKGPVVAEPQSPPGCVGSYPLYMDDTAKQILERELVDAVGPKAAQRALAKGEPETTPAHPLLAAAWSSRLLIGVLLVAAVVVGAFLSVLTGSWWLLGVALGVHAVGTVVILVTVFGLLGDVEAPSPTAAAALEARGVRDPDGALNELIERSQEDERGPGRRLLDGDGGDLPRPEHDPAESAHRQQSSWTPSGDPSRAVNRGD